MADATVIVAGSSKEQIKSLLPFARAIAPGGRIIALGLIAVSEDASLSAGALDARRLREGVEGRARRIGARVIIRVAHDVWRELKRVVTEEICNVLLMHYHHNAPESILRELDCDVVIVKSGRLKKHCRILLPIRGGPYAALALRIALTMAASFDGQITVLHAVPPSHLPDPSYEELLERLRDLPEVARSINVRGDAAKAILRAARLHDLIIMGAIGTPRPNDPSIGPTMTRVIERAQIPMLMVRSPQSLDIPPESLGGGMVDFTISVIVDKWFAENTFHAREFQDLSELVRLKEQQGFTISLGLPTLNEEKTIGKIIRTIRAKFIERYPLLDEIVVIDSNSTDHTIEIAESLGVPVVKHPEVLTHYEVWSGKGEALWNSLYILRGDLIAWIDTDIVNIHPRFVYGILGPLIREPNLVYVKGFYHRPLRLGGKLEARGGGRVTELVARPLLNLFYPELSGFVQPLAGEYAGRRSALESVPFFAGYGVEIGLLIDIWSRYGLHAMAQVDLDERVHRNQSLMALSKMAFEIIQVVMQRVGDARGVALLNELNRSIKLIRYSWDEFQLDVADLRDRERPPMITIPEYREKRKIQNDESIGHL